MARYQQLSNSEGGGVRDIATNKVIRRGDPGWDEYMGSLSAGEMPLPPGPSVNEDLATLKAKRCAEIDAYAAGLRNKVIAGRSPGEMASWALKLFDAMAVAGAQPSPFAAILPAIGTGLGLPSAPTSYNDAIAKVRGITEGAHVAKVLAQCAPFLMAEAAIDGTRGRHCDAVNAMPDGAAVVTYDWLQGWPEL